VKFLPTALACLAFAALAGLPAQAHHSAAMFDATRTESVDGMVKQYQWTNPHGWLFVSVPGAEGPEQDYSIELTSPNLLARRGWRPSTFKPGDKVKVVLNPFRDGKKGGRVVSITTADGKVFTER
jgi:Family of unknown function (DUF6152)